MSSMIFPGMDPYLENPHFWPGFHNVFVVYASEQLQPKIEPRYIAAVEARVYLESANRDVIPDAWLAGSPAGVYPTWHPPEPAKSSEGIAQPVLVTEDDIEVSEAYITILDVESGQRIVTVIEMLSPSNKLPGTGRQEYQAKQREFRHSDSHLV